MLEHERSIELISLAQGGDEAAKSELIANNYPLIKSIVKRFRNRLVEYDDLMQLGSMGLVKAINNFDVSYNVRFSTYAVPMIVGEIKRFIRDDGAVKVSRALKMQSAKINSFIEEYKSLHNSEPTLNEISAEFKISPQDVVFAMDSAKYPVSIFEKSDDDNLELLGKLSSGDNSDEIIDKMILKEIILALPERERKIIILRYFRDMTQSEIAKLFGISQVQISRIESRVLKQLKQKLEI